MASGYNLKTELENKAKGSLLKSWFIKLKEAQIQFRQLLDLLQSMGKKDIVDLLQTLLFCSLFASSIAVMPDLKNGVNTGKQFYFIFASSVVSILSIYKTRKGLVNNLYRITPTDVFVVAYLMYSLLNNLMTKQARLSEPDFVELMFMGVIYLVGKSFFNKENNFTQNIIILAFLGFGFYQAVYGLQQLYGFEMSHHSAFKVTGSFFNPAPFSGYLISIFPVGLAIYHFTSDKNVWNKLIKYLGLLTALSILLIIPSTLSRASWVALIAGTAIIYGHYYNGPQLIGTYLKTRLAKITVSLMVIVLIGSTAFGLYQWKKDSALGRVLIWEITLDMIKGNPTMGVGFGQYSAVFGKQQAAYFKSDQYTEEKSMVAGKGEYAFNEPLRIAAEQGLIGFLLFLGIIFTSFRNQQFTRSTKNDSKSALVVSASGGLVAILVFSLFSYPFSITPILLNLFFFLSILSAKSEHQPIFEINSSRVMRLISFVVLVTFTSWAVVKTKEKYDASESWKTASQLKSYGDHEEAIKMMQEIEPILKSNGNFMFEYGQALTLNKDYEKGIEVLEKATGLTSDPYLFNSLGNCYQGIKDYKKAEEAYIHAFYLIPHKFYPRYLLAKLYDEMGEKEMAIKTAQLLLNMKVKVPSTAIDEMKAEMTELVKSAGIKDP